MEKPTKGKLLLAKPFLEDSNFKRSVVLVCESNPENGALGLVLNRQLDAKIGEVLPDLDTFDAPIYFGGPVEQETLQFLHNCNDLIEGGVKLAKNLYWGGNFEQVKTLINLRQINNENIRFYIGYSGWGAEQLKTEMKEESWIVAPSMSEYVFATKPQKLWREVLRNMGTDRYRVMSYFPENPSLN